MSNYSMDFSICQHLIFGRPHFADCALFRTPTARLCLPSDHPPSRHWASAFALGATGAHLSHFSMTPRLVTSYTATTRLRAVASSVRSYRLSWVSPASGSASPQPAPLVSPVPRIPFGVSADQTLGHSGSDPSPPSWGTAARHSSVAVPSRLVYRPSEPSRLTRVVIGFPLESSPFDGLSISHSVQLVKGFLRFFLRLSAHKLGSNSHEKVCANHFGVPLLGSRGRPSEGLGFAPLLTLTFYHTYRGNTMENRGKFLTRFDMRAAGRLIWVAG